MRVGGNKLTHSNKGDVMKLPQSTREEEMIEKYPVPILVKCIECGKFKEPRQDKCLKTHPHKWVCGVCLQKTFDASEKRGK